MLKEKAHEPSLVVENPRLSEYYQLLLSHNLPSVELFCHLFQTTVERIGIRRRTVGQDVETRLWYSFSNGRSGYTIKEIVEALAAP